MDKGTEAPQASTEATAPIVFKGRTIQTYLPNEAQIAVIARLSFWDRNIGQDVERIRGGINRVGALLAGLMVDRADWEWIEDGMASREIQWEEVLDIFDLLADAHGLTNRADRRSRARKAAPAKARRG
jgi:hypothetical protein